MPHAVQLEVDLALEEVEEQRRVVEPPPLAAPAVGERLAEQLPGLVARRGSAPGRAPSRRRRRARSSCRRPSRSSLRKSSTSRTVFGESVLKNVELVVDPEALLLARPDRPRPPRRTRPPGRPPRRGAPRSPSMWMTKEKYGDGLKRVEPPLHQHRVRAQVDEDLALDERGDDACRSRGAAAARRRRSTPSAPRTPPSRRALLHGCRRLRRIVGRVLDLAAAGAGQVAGEQRLDLDDRAGTCSRPASFCRSR